MSSALPSTVTVGFRSGILGFKDLWQTKICPTKLYGLEMATSNNNGRIKSFKPTIERTNKLFKLSLTNSSQFSTLLSLINSNSMKRKRTWRLCFSMRQESKHLRLRRTTSTVLLYDFYSFWSEWNIFIDIFQEYIGKIIHPSIRIKKDSLLNLVYNTNQVTNM